MTLAEVIEAAELAWLAKGGDILDNAKHAHIAAAVLAHLSAPETVERARLALARLHPNKCPCPYDGCTCEVEARAAVAALAEDK